MSPDWEDPDRTPVERARALVEACRSRGQQKRLGAWMDQRAPEIRSLLVEQLVARGFPREEVQEWPGKRILRRVQDREDAAQQRTNPIARDEDFECGHCGRPVTAHGRTARDHCPFCLRSQHVDVVPGDRAETCHGLLDPIGLEQRGDRMRIHYRCRRCGAERVNQAILDGDPPDDWNLLVRLSAHEVVR